MSRIGKLPITIPDGIKVTIGEDSLVTVNGPKGEISRKIPSSISVVQEKGMILVTRPSDEKIHKAFHGLSRTLINNMVLGVKDGFEKVLTIVGTGYKAESKGTRIVFSLGYSHPIIFAPPAGVDVSIKGHNIKVSGIDKELVGEVSAKIRSFRPPEPYKGKGVRYKDEIVHIKAGKSGV